MGKPNLTAAEILHMLHDSVYRLLHQSQLNRNQNGLDASVVFLSGDAKRLNFAGTHMNIYSVPPHAPAVRYKGNKISLGYESADLPELDNIYFDISGEQIFALTTNGILSQPGTDKAILPHDFSDCQCRHQ
jgi:hypothetical protein